MACHFVRKEICLVRKIESFTRGVWPEEQCAYRCSFCKKEWSYREFRLACEHHCPLADAEDAVFSSRRRLHRCPLTRGMVFISEFDF